MTNIQISAKHFRLAIAPQNGLLGVTRRRKPLVECATPPRHLFGSKSQSLYASTKYVLDSKFTFVLHGEHFIGCAVRFAVKISQQYCASEQWLVTQRTCEDCDRMLLKIEGLARVGENNDFFFEIDLTSRQQTYIWIWNVEPG